MLPEMGDVSAYAGLSLFQLKAVPNCALLYGPAVGANKMVTIYGS